MRTGLRVTVESFAAWATSVALLYLANSEKAFFPATVVVILLCLAACVNRTSMTAMLSSMDYRIIVVVSVFLLAFVINPILHSWRDNIYVVPIVVASVIFIASLHQFFRRRHRSGPTR